MNNQLERPMFHIDPDTTPTMLIEHHLNEWLQLLDALQDAHAPTDQLKYCRNQVTRLQLDLFKLRNL